MNIFILIIIFVTVLMSFKKLAYGMGFFIATRILVPEIARFPGMGFLSLNSSLIIILIILTITSNYRYVVNIISNDKYAKILLLFVAYSIITLPLSDYLDLSEQLIYVFQFLLTDICPVILCVVIVRNSNDLKIVTNMLLLAIIICCLYGIFELCMQFNPYVNYFQAFYDYRDIALGERQLFYDGRGYGSSGTFVHSNGYGYFISMSIPLCAFLVVNKYKSKISLFALVLLIINLFLCKKKSPLISMTVFLLIWMCFNYKAKKIALYMKIFLIIFMGLVAIEMIPALQTVKNMLEASLQFWNDKNLAKTDVGGSNWDLRVRQLVYPFFEVDENLVFGHGAGWCHSFIIKYALHPVLYGFETIFSTAVCDYGIMGYFIYYILFNNSYKYSRPFNYKGVNYQLLNLVAEVVLIIATGLNYFYFFGIAIVLMHKYEINKLNEKNIYSNCNI